MTANATRVECGTPDTDPCAHRVVAEHLPDVAVFVFDRDLRFELATGAAVADTGWRPEAVLGRTLAELVPPERVASSAAPRRAALAGERQRFEVTGWREPGAVWSVDVVPIRDADGAVTGGMAVGTDVTERRRAERELRERRRQLAEGTCARAALVECSVTDRLAAAPLDPEVETALFRVAQQAQAGP